MRTSQRSYAYQGAELDVFKFAHNWKAYVARQLSGSLKGNVLEVGAGIGATTKALRGLNYDRWTCLEPDQELAGRLRAYLESELSSEAPEVIVGRIGDLDNERRFDSIIYMDVLEHIEKDGEELERAASHLLPNGRLIVLSPAHQWLFTEFDDAIGHYRRYNQKTLAGLAPTGLELEVCRYLDSAGMLLSLANRLVLRSSNPSRGQILTWDRYFVPLSRRIDPLLAFRLGKSILAIWKAAPAAS